MIAALALPLLLAAPAAGEAGYTVVRTSSAQQPLLADDEAAWSNASAVEWGPATYATRFRALWSEEGLFLRYDATDPDPWSTMTQRDDHLWEEEVVEIFLDPDGDGRDYYELEVSPANVVCDLRVITPPPEMKQDFPFDLAGLQTRAVVNRDAAGKTTGWTATALLPWAGLKALPTAAAVAVPPQPGDRWHFNLFRIKRPGGKKAPEKDGVFAAWSPTGAGTFHKPSAFRDMVFAGAR
ncbi:MAG TPA: carbohydrate-binding family 9-like protein [Vicinamibacteria bacterium]|nr:carbohydrate-binding family 9-like protein [Vicinamibacteria bacterium]